MRGSAAVQVTVANFTVWRFALASAGVVVTVVWVVWLMHLGVSGARLVAAIALVSGAAVWLGWPLRQVGPVALRWDGSAWHVGPDKGVSDAALRGAVHVHLDLGGWLLLRFVPESTSPSVAASWLPVQRQGSGQDWHALRCALYAPLPKPEAPLTGQGRAGT